MKKLRWTGYLFLVLCLLLSSCSLGGLTLESLTVDKTTVKTEYAVGDTVDFSGIRVTARYNDAAQNRVLTAADVTLLGTDALTETAGEKTVTVRYHDTLTNKDAETSFTVTVRDGAGAETGIVLQFEAPASYLLYANNVKDAGKAAAEDAAFEGQFFAGRDTKYYVGDDNPFIFRPQITLGDNYLPIATPAVIYTVVTAKVNGVDLRAQENGGEVAYYEGETLLFTYATAEMAYRFTEAADGKDITISVLPDATRYDNNDCAPVTVTLHVIDAYNVYTAKDLCVINNYAGNYTATSRGNISWDAFKEENGYRGISVKGIVLHNDVAVTADDVPASYFVTSDKEIVYYNPDKTVNKTLPVGTKFLRDESYVYRHTLAAGETFTVEGNYFTLDASAFPLIASNGAIEDSTVNYGGDFSNAVLFCFEGNGLDDGAGAYIYNVNFIGNANRNETCDAKECLVSAGGLIFEKTFGTLTAFDNVISRCFFITYFPDQQNAFKSRVTATYTKCYDSYQNAAFSWGETELNIDHSYWKRAGGPLCILQHNSPDSNPTSCIPTMTATDCVLESYVSGQELWFSSVGASKTAANMMEFSDLLTGYGLGSYKKQIGVINKMNLVCLIMSNGTNADDTIGKLNTQGKCTIQNGTKVSVLSRLKTDTTLGAPVYQLADGIKQATGGKFTPLFNVQSAQDLLFVTEQNNNYYLALPTQTLLNPQADATTYAAYAAAYGASEYVGMNYGGFGLLFGLSH